MDYVFKCPKCSVGVKPGDYVIKDKSPCICGKANRSDYKLVEAKNKGGK